MYQLADMFMQTSISTSLFYKKYFANLILIHKVNVNVDKFNASFCITLHRGDYIQKRSLTKLN